MYLSFSIDTALKEKQCEDVFRHLLQVQRAAVLSGNGSENFR